MSKMRLAKAASSQKEIMELIIFIWLIIIAIGIGIIILTHEGED